MRTRLQVTDGRQTIDVYWVEHTGSDIYFGFSKADGKRSYHASGKQHATYGGAKGLESAGVPLQQIKGVHPLSNMFIGDLVEQLKARGVTHKYSGRRSDHVLVLDSRGMPRNAECHVELGLLEPGALEALAVRVRPSRAGTRRMVPHQVLIATSKRPWVYAIALWLLPPSSHVGTP